MSELAINGGTPVRRTAFAPSQTIGREEREAACAVIDSGALSGFLGTWSDEFFGGPRVQECERAFAKHLGAADAITVNSATTGLQAAYTAVGVGPGDEVIVPPFTMSATAAAVLSVGGTPVFADVEEVTYGLDPAAVAERITPRTKAISVVHLFGHPARMDDILELANTHGLRVVEDAAQSIGAMFKGTMTGAIGDAGVLSLNRHKIIQTGEGGVVLTNDADIGRRLRLVRNHGEVVLDDMGAPELAGLIGSNFRMAEIEAAIALAQLQKLDGLLAWRRRLAARLETRLREIPGLVPATVAPGCSHSYYLFAIRLEPWLLEEVPRAVIAAAVSAEGIPISAGYVRPIYWQSLYDGRDDRYARGACPVTERLHTDELLLTDVCRAPLDERDIDDVADAFAKVLGQRARLAAGTLG